MKLLEGSGQQLTSKATKNKSVNGCTTACYDKSGRQTTMQQPTNNGSSKDGQWLVTRPPEDSGQHLAAKAVSNKSIDSSTTVCYDKVDGGGGQ